MNVYRIAAAAFDGLILGAATYMLCLQYGALTGLSVAFIAIYLKHR